MIVCIENGPQTFGSSRKKQDGEWWQFAQWLCDYWHTVAITARYAYFGRYTTVGEVRCVHRYLMTRLSLKVVYL
jgi:hypothetical protein